MKNCDACGVQGYDVRKQRLASSRGIAWTIRTLCPTCRINRHMATRFSASGGPETWDRENPVRTELKPPKPTVAS